MKGVAAYRCSGRSSVECRAKKKNIARSFGIQVVRSFISVMSNRIIYCVSTMKEAGSCQIKYSIWLLQQVTAGI